MKALFFYLLLSISICAQSSSTISKIEGLTSEGKKCTYILQQNAVSILAEGDTPLFLGLQSSLPLVNGYYAGSEQAYYSYSNGEFKHEILFSDVNGDIIQSLSLIIYTDESMENPTSLSLSNYYPPFIESEFTCSFPL